jgi:hypothetical protein
VARNYKAVAKQLLTGARAAHTELFALSLAEKAARVRGRYTDAFQRLDKAIREAEAALKDEEK